MKKMSVKFSLFSVCLILLIGCLFTACNNDDEPTNLSDENPYPYLIGVRNTADEDLLNPDIKGNLLEGSSLIYDNGKEYDLDKYIKKLDDGSFYLSFRLLKSECTRYKLELNWSDGTKDTVTFDKDEKWNLIFYLNGKEVSTSDGYILIITK